MSESSLKRAVREHTEEFGHDVALDDAEHPTRARCRLCAFSYDADGNDVTGTPNPDGAGSADLADPAQPADPDPTGTAAAGAASPTAARKTSGRS